MIVCSHCKEMRPAHLVVDSLCNQTICDSCIQKNHNNVMKCPVCGLSRAEPCLHEFSPTVEGVAHCGRCGQLRVENPMSVPNKQAKAKTAKTTKCVHCGGSDYAPNGICVTCSLSGHSMFGPCSKCAAEEAKAAEEIKDSCEHTWETANSKKYCTTCGKIEQVFGEPPNFPTVLSIPTVFGDDAECLKQGHMVIKNDDLSWCGRCGQILSSTSHLTLEEYKKVYKGKLAKKEAAVSNPLIIAPPLQYVPIPSKKKIPQEKMEGMICPHCDVYFEVEGDIKTWDVVYLTCQVCFAKGHRRMPAKCEVCAKDLVGFAKGIAQETLKEIKKAEAEEKDKEKFGRNIIL